MDIRATLRNMEKEDTVNFPIESLRSVRTIASELGLIMTRKYRTWTDREQKLIFVNRYL